METATIHASFRYNPKFAAVAAKDDTRYAFSSILVDRFGDNARLTATDGRMAAVAICVDGNAPDDKYLVSAEVMKKGDFCELNGQAAIRKDGRGSSTVCADYKKNGDDAHFPPVADVFPATAGRHFIALNAKMLAILQAAIGNTETPDGSVLIAFDAPNRPICVMGSRGIGLMIPFNHEALTPFYKGISEDLDEAIAGSRAAVQSLWEESLAKHGIIK